MKYSVKKYLDTVLNFHIQAINFSRPSQRHFLSCSAPGLKCWVQTRTGPCRRLFGQIASSLSGFASLFPFTEGAQPFQAAKPLCVHTPTVTGPNTSWVLCWLVWHTLNNLCPIGVKYPLRFPAWLQKITLTSMISLSRNSSWHFNIKHWMQHKWKNTWLL